MNSPVAGVRLLLLGATGAVGQQVLRLALEDERVAQVTAPTRRPLTPHSKLRNPVTDFSALPDAAPVWDADAVICALGSTIRKAGSEPHLRPSTATCLSPLRSERGRLAPARSL
jgi:NAD dependent epimerase/dehydratase family enzyme